MNLYRLIVLHGGPKSSCTATFGYMLAGNDEQVYNRLNDEAYWDDANAEFLKNKLEHMTDYPEDRLSPKEQIMKDCGDLEDEKWDDAYYGIWKYGWENLGPITDEESDILAKFKIV